jgi:hypothetical protein
MIFQEAEKKTTRNIDKEQSHRFIYNIIKEIINIRQKKREKTINIREKYWIYLHRRYSIINNEGKKRHR